MQRINLAQIVSDNNLDKKEIAKELFPMHTYPMLAYKRIIKGDAVLNSDQISKLASITGLSIAQIFSGENWKSKKTGNLYTFTSGNYKAVLDTDTWITKIYLKDSLLHESVIMKKTVPLNEYLENLNSIIIKS